MMHIEFQKGTGLPKSRKTQTHNQGCRVIRSKGFWVKRESDS